MIAGEGALVLGVMLAVASVFVMLDWWLRFPSAVRAVMLVALLVLAWHLSRRYMLPALRFRPTSLDIAFRLERREAQLRGRLASAVDFATTKSGTASRATHEGELEERLTREAISSVAETIDATEAQVLRSPLRYGPFGKRAIVLVLASCTPLLFLCFSPNLFGVGMLRFLSPWSAARWPARTEVHSLLGREMVLAKGVPLALRAELTRGDSVGERVWAHYRVRQDATQVWGAWNDALLARQPNSIYERILEVDGGEMEVVFLSAEDESEASHITLVDAPAIVSAAFTAQPPTYLQDHNIALEPISQLLGDGTDARAVVVEPVLEGSVVHITAQLNGAAEVSLAGSEGFEGVVQLDDNDPTSLTIDGLASGAAKIHVKLHDQHGLENRSLITFAFDTIPDRLPTATVTDPPHDESFVVDAVIPLRAELRDDLGLARVGFEYAIRDGTASGASSEQFVREDVVAAKGVLQEETRLLPLSSFKVSPGDTVLVRAVAEDVFQVNGTHHDRVRSAPRALRVVGTEEFEQQLRSAIASIRRDAKRTDELQARVQERLQGGASAESEKSLSQAQAEVGEAISRHTKSLEAIARRLQRNNHTNDELTRLTREAGTTSDEAEVASDEASRQLAAAEDPSTDPTQQAKAMGQAATAQETVRADLEALISMLDRDADSWLSKRHIEELRARIEALTRKTDALAQRTQAKAREELSVQERAALDELAAAQQDAADDTDALVDELQARQKEVQGVDPALARALESAAKAAREGQTRESLEQAAASTKSNQLAQAATSERSAAAALSQAAQALEDVGKVRAEELARMLESLVESVQRILQQTEALIPKFDGVAEIELHARLVGQLAQNTRGLASDARGAGRAASRVAPFLERAAESLSAAASLLRREPPAIADAKAAGESAIASLLDALKLAEEAKERAERDAATEKREELLEQYRALLERQLSLKGLTERVTQTPEKPLTRRDQVELRRLSVAQGEVRGAISSLAQSEEAITKSAAFTEVHEEIDQSLERAVVALSQGDPVQASVAQTDGAQGMGDLIAALGEDADEDPFAERQQPQGETGGGGGSGQSSDPIPPLAELKLLRQMQRQLFQKTLRLESAREAGLAAELLAVERAALAAKQARIVELAERLAQSMEQSKGTSLEGRPTTKPEEAPVEPPQEPPTQQYSASWRYLWWV